MTTVLVAGIGAVGTRATRQLADTPGVDRLLITDRDPARASAVAANVGGPAAPVDWAGELPSGIAAAANALPGPAGAALARRLVAAAVPVAAVADDELAISDLLGMDRAARAAGVTIAVSCGLVPGLGDVLARHAADALDSADEVHVARAGAAGDACVASLRAARRAPPLEWYDGAWRSDRAAGPELVWFPDPVDARECQLVAPGAELLRAAVPGATRISVRAAEPPVRSPALALVRRRPVDDGWGAARVQVWGWLAGTREAVVYGVIERPAVAAGTVLAVTTARLAGLLPSLPLLPDPPAGAFGLGALVQPAPFLAELARRGVKAAKFEGMAVA